ncbi:MAG: hypothetical protein LBR47_00610 [Spirochaetaceae bacterium]|nr:hypothetical protein [Spirochaetaceae bacterium]
MSFGIVTLRAFLCGIGTAGIGMGTLFALHKFLPELWDGISGDTQEEESVPQTSGGAVDITVEDDHLGLDTGGVSFYMRPESKKASEAETRMIPEGEERKPSFTPEPENSAAPAASARAAFAAEKSAPPQNDGEPELDSLPDMGDILSLGKGKSSENAIGSDVFKASDASVVSGSDVATMARAISSMLAKDS